jgi:hypothetical protein
MNNPSRYEADAKFEPEAIAEFGPFLQVSWHCLKDLSNLMSRVQYNTSINHSYYNNYGPLHPRPIANILTSNHAEN